jgi:hypothetical protein
MALTAKQKMRNYRYTHNVKTMEMLIKTKDKVTLLLELCMNCQAGEKACKKCTYKKLIQKETKK